MSLISAMQSATQGFLRSVNNIGSASARISKLAHDKESQERAGEDLVKIETEKIAVKANFRIITVASDIFREMTNLGR